MLLVTDILAPAVAWEQIRGTGWYIAAHQLAQAPAWAAYKQACANGSALEQAVAARRFLEIVLRARRPDRATMDSLLCTRPAIAAWPEGIASDIRRLLADADCWRTHYIVPGYV